MQKLMIRNMLQSRVLAAGKIGRKYGMRRTITRGFCQENSSASQGSGDTQGYAPIPTGRTADPAVHASEPQVEIKGGSGPTRAAQEETSSFATPNRPLASSPKLEHTEVGLPSKPNTDQRRQLSTHQAHPSPESIPEITCSGLDGSPWPDDAEGQKAQNKSQEEDNKEYFKDHKASPLSEIEFADSRKPISQATDGDTNAKELGAKLILFNDEQNETAEQTLLRTAEFWQWNKMRGDPDSPHGKVLRQLRGEYW